MDLIHTPHELMERIEKLDKHHSVCQAKDAKTIASEVQADPQLGELIQSSRNAYQRGVFMTTSELLNSLSSKDFVQ